MGGHVVDANTVHLWKLNDSTALNGCRTAVDAMSASALQTLSYAVAPKQVRGPRGNTYARGFNGTSSLFTRTANLTGWATLFLTTAWTFRCWFNADTLAALRPLFSFGAAGASSNVNVLCQPRITTTGKMEMFWESGTAVAQTTTQSAGATIVANTWYGGAWVKSGANVLFYLFDESGNPIGGGNGLQDTVAYGANAASGSSGTIVVGADYPSSVTARFLGSIGAMEILNTDINAAAVAAGFVNTTFTSGANTFALWNMTEAPDAVDSANNLHLTCTGSLNTYAKQAPAILGVEKTSFFDGTGDGYLEGPYAGHPAQTALATLFASNNYTIEFLVRHAMDKAIANGWFCFGTPGSDASSTINILSFVCAADRKLSALSEYNTGTDAAFLSASEIYNATTFYDPHYIAIVRNGTNHKVYSDAVEIASFSFSNQYTDGSLGTMKFPINTATIPLIGYMGDFRISNISRTTTEISDYYAALLATPGPPNSMNYRRYGAGGEV